jgi:hypothetical protein
MKKSDSTATKKKGDLGGDVGEGILTKTSVASGKKKKKKKK